ncbi:mycothiol synthase [Ruania zhangjianzhongii]|uniref:mycothiol synthase n=1 Tax=Ruania zhangjianzhongii TaxID=2603206 RepID=UPI0011CAF788|nr:mycothiol synthase [Ruania zhangjianzhongii]
MVDGAARPGQHTLTRLAELSGTQADGVTHLAAAVAAADGIEAFSEQMLLNLTDAHREVTHLLLTAPAETSSARGEQPGQQGSAVEILGYAQIDDGGAELAIHPDRRRRGLGRLLTGEVLTEPGVRLWAHGDLPAAKALAEALGLQRVRDLHLMSTTAPRERTPVPGAEGITVRTFEVGRDEDAWLAVNARSFADHPEQGRLTRADLDARIAQPWFDPTVFFLAEDAVTGQLLGSLWVKIEETVGEIYALGVDPDAQGRGLGGLLTAHAMAAFAGTGLDRLELYVEGENTAAIRTYARVGFTKERADVQYARPTG